MLLAFSKPLTRCMMAGDGVELRVPPLRGLIKLDGAAVPDYANHQLARQYLARASFTLYDRQVDDDRPVI